ncbi:MAG TPA: F0F1 ATP synthase subunit delta [Acidimicrobiales bacterium]|nr:F0F1 ATP synthase subunit delta [Acidimicrobiales bacterium]
MLARIEGYAAALLGTLDASSLATCAAALTQLDQAVLGRGDLRAVLGDTSIAGPVRGAVVRELITDKLDATTVRIAVYAATVAPAQEVAHSWDELAFVARELVNTGHFGHDALSLIDSRRRVGGFADALLEDVDTSLFATIEDELFRWARTVEASVELRRLLLDRDAPVEVRLATTVELLRGRVSDPTMRLARYVIEGGRPRDVVGTLDFLVDYVAKARDWRVARVHTARPLDEANEATLVASLRALTGQNVELQVAQEPELLGGILVEVGDLRLDATTRSRLGALRDDVTSANLYRTTL